MSMIDYWTHQGYIEPRYKALGNKGHEQIFRVYFIHDDPDLDKYSLTREDAKRRLLKGIPNGPTET